MDLGWLHLVPYTATNARFEQLSDRLDRVQVVNRLVRILVPTTTTPYE
jgi:hypothetical protein